MMELTRERPAATMHRRMVRIRLFEEAAGKLAEAGKLPGFLHLYVGQEAVAAGVCDSAQRSTTTSPRRTAATATSSPRAATSTRMMAELMGKSTGYCKGKGGSMHISDLDARDARRQRHRRCRRRRSPSAPAFANKYRGTRPGVGRVLRRRRHEHRRVPRGRQHGLRAAPAGRVRLREQRVRRVHPHASKTMAITDIVDRAAGYGMPGVIVDGMDVVAVHEAASEAVARARRGDGPSLIEAKTYRFYNHHGVQNLGLKYRTDDEVAGVEGARPDLHLRGAADRAGTVDARRASSDVWAELRADIDDGDRVRRGEPVPRRRPAAGRRLHARRRSA